MITEHEYYSLQALHTFRMNIQADRYISVTAEEEILPALGKAGSSKILILGGGSNVLFSGNFHGVILHPLMKGIRVVKRSDDFVWLNAKAGEVWDDLVSYAVNNGFYGLENLSLIPGHVGASPIQNIGAYGIEAKDAIESVRFLNLNTRKFEELSNVQCGFGYRDSIFKHELKNKILITDVTFRLSLNERYSLDYGSIKEELKKHSGVNLKTVRTAIIDIRTSKLPDPAAIPNAGSFFKNPVVSLSHYHTLLEKYPDIPHYKNSETEVKIPAAWLIEKCGWKGYRVKDAGVHVNQPLVLVNYGNASGQEVVALAQNIIRSVEEKMKIRLEMEVNMI